MSIDYKEKLPRAQTELLNLISVLSHRALNYPFERESQKERNVKMIIYSNKNIEIS